jgi:hypothetical protein
MRIQVVHAKVPGTTKYFKPLLDRIVRFNDEFGGDCTSEELYAHLAPELYNENPETIFWVGLDESDKVVGHGYAGIERYYSNLTVNVHHFWKDEDQEFKPGQIEDVVKSMSKWGRSKGATELRCVADNEIVAKIFEEKYGWERIPRILMRRAFTDENEE